ncbi:MAG: acetyl-CoA carboxylase biotin carboxyl carrier protein [Rhodospirillales bacterium]|nr:acetyl-CoA carboxylase biotin carboxyl carrier protein [Rhodospirillales bacterium]
MPKDGSKPEIDSDLVHKLAQLLDETGLAEIEYGTQDWHLRVSKGGGAPVTVAAAAAPVAPAAAPAAETAEAGGEEDIANHPGLLTSPMVGIAYTQSEPDAPPLVSVGQSINEGDTVILIEAMKVFNPIKAPKSGKVTRILVSNGAPVEFGEPLLIIE